MNKKLIVLIVVSLLPAYATAASLDLKQDLGGPDIAVMTDDPDSPDAIKITNKSNAVVVPDIAVMTDDPDSPDAIKITNKSNAVVACTLSYTGADAGTVATPVTIQPGKSGTIRVTVDASTPTRRSANLKCAEKMVASKK